LEEAEAEGVAVAEPLSFAVVLLLLEEEAEEVAVAEGGALSSLLQARAEGPWAGLRRAWPRRWAWALRHQTRSV